MSDIPNIQIPKMRSSGDDWCKHYAGFFNPGISTGKKTHCDAGVEYDSVAVKVEFTTQRHHERTPYLQHEAHPCFKHQAHLTGGCPKCEYYTAAELKQRDEESAAEMNRYVLVRAAIIDDLKGAKGGQGKISCPACKTGTVSYSRAASNGHVHARCSTEGCASWME